MFSCLLGSGWWAWDPHRTDLDQLECARRCSPLLAAAPFSCVLLVRVYDRTDGPQNAI